MNTDGRTLPWRVFGRVVKPYAFAASFATAVVSWAILAGVAVATDVPNPGRDEAVVTDAAILAAVDAIVNPAPVEGE